MATQTVTEAVSSLTLTPSESDRNVTQEEKKPEEQESYRYAALLPHFSSQRYPPLEPFEHQDPGFRALEHEDPRAFLRGASSVIELTPNLGTEVHGVNLANLSGDERDELALEVCHSEYYD